MFLVRRDYVQQNNLLSIRLLLLLFCCLNLFSNKIYCSSPRQVFEIDYRCACLSSIHLRQCRNTGLSPQFTHIPIQYITTSNWCFRNQVTSSLGSTNHSLMHTAHPECKTVRSETEIHQASRSPEPDRPYGPYGGEATLFNRFWSGWSQTQEITFPIQLQLLF